MKCPLTQYTSGPGLRLDAVSPHWTPGLLLSQSGLFALEEVVACLSVPTARIKAACDAVQRAGGDAWTEVGVRYLNGRWVLWMDAFAGFYLSRFHGEIQPIPDGGDINQLLAQKGVFYLNDVCRLIPFQPASLRYQATAYPDLGKAMGIRKVNETFVVDMAMFGPWLREFWLTVTDR